MKKTTISVRDRTIPVITCDTAVIGSGCAGLNAADWLHTFTSQNKDTSTRDHSIIIVTEGINKGTSRNTGSDKQTYYKLSLSGKVPDSIGDMASDLFAGKGMHGDTAMADAAGSVRSFIKLCNLGVPFPYNKYGEYPGYKTDHDPRRRATGAGPLTGRYMTECLERAVREKEIPILDNMTAVKLITAENTVYGVICIDSSALNQPHRGITIIAAKNIIAATGGPAICYSDSVYPESQTGMSGMFLEAGAKSANLNEWQYGIAALKFRWNLSGTYQQVIPTYYSVDSNGVKREFLRDVFNDPGQLLNNIFLKGYQWPFDTEKLTGSSLIDVSIYNETVIRKRRVFMDFRTNPQDFDFTLLNKEAYDYLKNSGALFGTPVERLKQMNAPAIKIFKDNGIDLYNEPLEAGICAQHHNGGIDVDVYQRTSLNNLYAVGESAGTFGLKRPGGSALNAAQTGSLRAAEHISDNSETDYRNPAKAESVITSSIASFLDDFMRIDIRPGVPPVTVLFNETVKQMSTYAAHIRNPGKISELARTISASLNGFFRELFINNIHEIPQIYKIRDTLITLEAVLSAMITSAGTIGSSGSALVTHEKGELIHPDIEIKYLPGKAYPENKYLSTESSGKGYHSEYKNVRPLPRTEQWFETVWNEYIEKKEKGSGFR